MLNRRLPLILLLSSLTTLSCSDFLNKDKEYITTTNGQGGGITGNTGNKAMALPEYFSAPNDGEFSQEKMIINMGVNVGAPAVEYFSANAIILTDRVEKYCANPSETSLKVAQDQWTETMLAYHTVAAVPFGPKVENEIPLDQKIYAWPNFNLCAVDEDVARYAEGERDFSKRAPNRRGLGALEYLLFTESFRCPNANAFPKLKVWAGQSVEKQKQDRCGFMAVMAKDVAENAKAYSALWDKNQNNYAAQLVNLIPFPEMKTAVNQMSNGLYAVEDIKDWRLGAPVGLHETCVSPSKKCPEKAEHPWSGIAIKAIIAQLKGFKMMFNGTKSPSNTEFGFDDLLVSVGHREMAEQIVKDADIAIAHAEQLDTKGTLQQQIEAMDAARCQQTTLENGLEPICLLQRQVRETANAYKTNVLSTLSLDAPAGAGPSDND